MKKLIFLAALLYGGISYGQTYYLNEDFEGAGAGLPPGWDYSSADATSDGWKWGTSESLSSTALSGIIFGSHTKIVATNDDKCGQTCNKSNDVIYTPLVDLSGATGTYLKFDVYFAGATYDGKTEKAFLQVSKDGGQNWSALEIPGMGVPGASGVWNTFTLPLVDFEGSSQVRFAFQYTDGGGWLYGMGLDNVQVFTPEFQKNVKLTKVVTEEFNVVNTPNAITCIVQNLGAEPITSLETSWRLNGGDWQTSVITGLNIGFYGSDTFAHPLKFTLTEPKKHNIEVLITKVNGGEDEVPNDNQQSTVAYGLTLKPEKHVVIEEFSGAWCQYCPIGHVLLKKLLDENNKVHGVVVHNGDAMVIPDGTTLENALGVDGFPGMAVDRTILEGEIAIPLNQYYEVIDKTPTRLDDVVLGEIAIENLNYNPETRKIVISTQATVYGEYDKSLRFNAYIVEDSVSGTGPGYNQVNATDGDPEIWPGLPNPNYQKGNPMIGYQHMHVLRAYLEGTWGAQGSFPSGSVQANDTYNHEFQYTIPNEFDEKNIRVIVTLANYDANDVTKRNIINAAEANTLITNVGKNNVLAKSLQVYPNPTNGVLNINYNGANAVKATVSNSLGQSVGVYDVKGATQIDLTSMPSGVYVLNFNDGVNSYTHKIIVQ